MIDASYLVAMAAYNRWQNDNLYGAAATLTDAARKQDRGAFFGSIHATLNHLLWADEFWMARFTDRTAPSTPMATSHLRYTDWSTLEAERRLVDDAISAWAPTVEPAWLARTAPRSKRTNAFLVTHLFNHQTHHRGQVHALLTAAGATPGDTDLLKLP